jgi:hypothetical protein
MVVVLGEVLGELERANSPSVTMRCTSPACSSTTRFRDTEPLRQGGYLVTNEPPAFRFPEDASQRFGEGQAADAHRVLSAGPVKAC